MPEFTGSTGAANLLVVGDFSNFLVAQRAGMSVELIPHLFATGNNRPSGQRGWLPRASRIRLDQRPRFPFAAEPVIGCQLSLVDLLGTLRLRREGFYVPKEIFGNRKQIPFWPTISPDLCMLFYMEATATANPTEEVTMSTAITLSQDLKLKSAPCRLAPCSTRRRAALALGSVKLAPQIRQTLGCQHPFFDYAWLQYRHRTSPTTTSCSSRRELHGAR